MSSGVKRVGAETAGAAAAGAAAAGASGSSAWGVRRSAHAATPPPAASSNPTIPTPSRIGTTRDGGAGRSSADGKSSAGGRSAPGANTYLHRGHPRREGTGAAKRSVAEQFGQETMGTVHLGREVAEGGAESREITIPWLAVTDK